MNSSNEKLVIDYIVACTNLYGVTPFQQLCLLYNEQNADQISLEELNIFVNSVSIKERLEERFVFVHAEEFVSEAVNTMEEKQLLQHMTAGKPFYVPDQTELLRYVDEHYFQRTPQQEQLKKQLCENFDDRYLVDEEVEGLVYNLQVSGGDFSTVLSMFLDDLQLPIEQAERYIPVIIEIAETTRLWENRGHTQKEIIG